MKRLTTNLYGIDISLTEERTKLLEGGWEYNRMLSMMANIKKGDVVFDIGAEIGDMSVIMGKKSGKIVLFEPSPTNWPFIRENFRENNIKPLDCYAGFASSVTDEQPEEPNFDSSNDGIWPKCAFDNKVDVRAFRHLDQGFKTVKQITIDDYCERTDIWPDVVTMDTEGSEWHVLQGMSKVIDRTMPIIYISIHCDFLKTQYDKWPMDIFTFFDERSYKYRMIGFDHEIHLVAFKKSLIVSSEII